jgi:hypothetical protein
MADPKDLDALTEDGRAPVLSEDQAETPPDADADEAKAIDLPIEEGDFDAQPG